MEIDQMEKCMEAGERPIDLSIEKWKDIIDGTGENYEGQNQRIMHEV